MNSKQNFKENVYKVYNIISGWYFQNRSRDLFEKSYLDRIISLIKPNSKILDLGCGTGKPIAEYFIKQGFSVTGVDASERLIDIAAREVPSMKCIFQDMRSISLGKKFDCIFAWHSFFHLTKSDQRNIFGIFEKHIVPNGVLVFTSGPDEGEIYSENGGQMLYHASLSQQEYKKLLDKHNFELLSVNVEDPDCGDATIWIARYKS